MELIIFLICLIPIVLILKSTKKKNNRGSIYSFKKTELKNNKNTLKTKRGLFGGRINPEELPKTKDGKKVEDVSYEFDKEQFVDDNPTYIGSRGGRYKLVRNKYGKTRRDYF